MYLINITSLIVYLQRYDSKTVFEKLPLQSSIGLLQCFANILEDDYPAPADLFIGSSIYDVHKE